MSCVSLGWNRCWVKAAFRQSGRQACWRFHGNQLEHTVHMAGLRGIGQRGLLVEVDMAWIGSKRLQDLCVALLRGVEGWRPPSQGSTDKPPLEALSAEAVRILALT